MTVQRGKPVRCDEWYREADTLDVPQSTMFERTSVEDLHRQRKPTPMLMITPLNTQAWLPYVHP